MSKSNSESNKNENVSGAISRYDKNYKLFYNKLSKVFETARKHAENEARPSYKDAPTSDLLELILTKSVAYLTFIRAELQALDKSYDPQFVAIDWMSEQAREACYRCILELKWKDSFEIAPTKDGSCVVTSTSLTLAKSREVELDKEYPLSRVIAFVDQIIVEKMMQLFLLVDSEVKNQDSKKYSQFFQPDALQKQKLLDSGTYKEFWPQLSLDKEKLATFSAFESWFNNRIKEFSENNIVENIDEKIPLVSSKKLELYKLYNGGEDRFSWDDADMDDADKKVKEFYRYKNCDKVTLRSYFDNYVNDELKSVSNVPIAQFLTLPEIAGSPLEYLTLKDYVNFVGLNRYLYDHFSAPRNLVGLPALKPQTRNQAEQILDNLHGRYNNVKFLDLGEYIPHGAAWERIKVGKRLQQFTKLEKLKLGESFHLDEKELLEILKLPNLKSLDLSTCIEIDKDIIEGIKKAPKLESLYLRENTDSDLYDKICGLKVLKVLDCRVDEPKKWDDFFKGDGNELKDEYQNFDLFLGTDSEEIDALKNLKDRMKVNPRLHIRVEDSYPSVIPSVFKGEKGTLNIPERFYFPEYTEYEFKKEAKSDARVEKLVIGKNVRFGNDLACQGEGLAKLSIDNFVTISRLNFYKSGNLDFLEIGDGVTIKEIFVGTENVRSIRSLAYYARGIEKFDLYGSKHEVKGSGVFLAMLFNEGMEVRCYDAKTELITTPDEIKSFTSLRDAILANRSYGQKLTTGLSQKQHDMLMGLEGDFKDYLDSCKPKNQDQNQKQNSNADVVNDHDKTNAEQKGADNTTNIAKKADLDFIKSLYEEVQQILQSRKVDAKMDDVNVKATGVLAK